MSARVAQAGEGTLSAGDADRCRRSLKKGSKSFYAASRLLPGRLRAATSAIYAFCRATDDVVDSLDSRGDVVDALRDRLDGIYRGVGLDDPVDRSFAWAVREHRIPREIPSALLEGYEWDLRTRRYRTISEVRAYSARVAASVGVMMTLVMGRRQPEVLARACDLGVAMQLTNICRDVGEDARAKRLYLPTEWLEDTGVEPDELLREPVFSPELGTVVQKSLAEADRLYVRCEPGIEKLPGDCRASIWAARFIYADIGRAIAANGHDSVSLRAHTTIRRKLRLLARACFRRVAGGPPARGIDQALQETAFLIDAVGRADL
jgi:phytoene synthase